MTAAPSTTALSIAAGRDSSPKGVDSIYHTGKRSRDWRKLKIVHEQEFVVGGWTESRTSGRPFGALLLGYYEDGGLEYAGHTGSGFDQRELERVVRLLKPLEVTTSPFKNRPRTNERPHWTTPALVAQVKFTEWTDEGFLRHPIYLGLRDDVKPETVRREKKPMVRKGATVAKGAGSGSSANQRSAAGRNSSSAKTAKTSDLQNVLDQLEEIERGPNAGTLQLPDGTSLDVSNLRKVFWPKLKITKGELMRYYVRVSPLILPVVTDRPLIMKRFPNGIDGKAFYQQRAPENVPAGVRTATIAGDEEVPSRTHRRQSDHAALSHPARRDLAGSVVFARAVAAHRRPLRH